MTYVVSDRNDPVLVNALASAIANAGIMRCGSPLIENILEVLPRDCVEEATEIAQTAVALLFRAGYSVCRREEA